uniref:Secreted protein n=1 Tax=Syphacia muris TaxID=451379 RepID=A0A0N5AIZ6_9BILA
MQKKLSITFLILLILTTVYSAPTTEKTPGNHTRLLEKFLTHQVAAALKFAQSELHFEIPMCKKMKDLLKLEE